jgi:hypothetical protein
VLFAQGAGAHGATVVPAEHEPPGTIAP